MALGGILVANVIFIILLIIFALFILSLLLFIIFTILRAFDKNKKWKKVLQIITGILTIIFLIPLLLTKIFLTNQSYDRVNYNGKEVKIKKEIVDKFYSEVSYCDIEEINKYLDKYPELINSKTLEGLYPLGESIKYEKIDCIKYFVNKGVDINKPSNNLERGTLEYMFYYGYYNDEILEYLLDREDIDINKRHSAMPVAQLYIKTITKDKEISDEELKIFQKMLNKGLDLTLTNGTDTDTYNYVNGLSDNIVNIDKLRELINKNK